MTDRVTTRRRLPEDPQVEQPLRPARWDDYVGQDKVKDSLHVFIQGARARNEALDHVLFYGPPGLGKTT
ncbi:MAG: Holliday junction branch migration DNA helicase RuvB, partial [candidate division NC10 bacterium]|nr:Holliday junction branch migration DNA helicase RuvB [candidate division NC10 bacterium]